MPAVATEDDVTLLFEHNSVAQVQDILKKTRCDIEKKKEDLRVMVGERYRDLIEAADTISEMRNSAEAICGNIHTMEGLCESLQQRGLIGFKTQTQQSNGTGRSPSPGSHYSVAVQVKLLVAVPEILWSLTEHCHYLPATQLLLLAHHTHTALQLAPNAPKIHSWFPVIERQWASIAQFRATIVRGCSNLISSEVDDVQAVLNAVVAVMLVEGCSSSEVLSRVLQLRHAALMSAVAPKPSATAKGQISQFVTLFLASLNIIHAIFGKDKEGESLLERRLKEVVKGDGEDGPPIAHLQESSLTLSFLPQSIRDFRPSVQGQPNSLSDSHLKMQVSKWLNQMLHEASQALGVLLSFTTSIKALSMIRASVWEICQAKVEKEQWKKTTEDIYGSHLDPWDSVVRVQVTERARQVILTQLTSAKDAIVQMVAKLAFDINADPKICTEEGDITGFVWSESAGDLPERVGWTCASSRTVTQAGGLYYKTRGYTSRIQTVCRALNSRLTALLQDVGHYNSGSTNGELGIISSSSVGDEDISAKEDYTTLLNFLQDTSTSIFTQLVLELENLAQNRMSDPAPRVQDGWEEDKETSSLTAPSTILVVIGRVCLALPNVCPQMQICASAASLANPDVARRVSLGSKLESETWMKVRSELQGASSRLFGIFLSSLTSHLGSDVKTFLTTELSSGGVAAAISSFPTWEMVDIEEEGESGNVVKSSIHVPAHPTPALTQALSRLCTSVNCVAAHTITRNAQSELTSSACEAVTSAYESALVNKQEVNQTLALQLIFDIKFIQTILLPRDNKDVGSRLTAMVQKLESNVDPFDLDVFTPHISTRVKLAAHRSQVVLGAILSRDRQVITGRAPAVGNSSTTTNNALPIVQVVEIPRFSNVPLPITSSRPTIHTSLTTPNLASMNEGLSPKLSNSKDQSSPSSSRREMSSAALSASRSAASLLSAMSSSWFGSSSSS